ncbi:hypothetical protein CL617_00080 [archaeon]|nr:hypothetical protein [archaeon]
MLCLLSRVKGFLSKEYVFIILFLLASLLFFDVAGVDYNTNDKITGAQNIDVEAINEVFDNLYDLVFSGFLAPVVDAVDKDAVLAVRLLIAILLFGLLHVVFNKSQKFGKMGNVIAAVIGLAVAAFMPKGIMEAYFDTDGIARMILGLGLNLALIIGVFVSMHKWKSKGVMNFVKGGVYFLILILFFGIFGRISQESLSIGNFEYLLQGFAYLGLLIGGLYHIFVKGVAGVGSSSDPELNQFIQGGGVKGTWGKIKGLWGKKNNTNQQPNQQIQPGEDPRVAQAAQAQQLQKLKETLSTNNIMVRGAYENFASEISKLKNAPIEKDTNYTSIRGSMAEIIKAIISFKKNVDNLTNEKIKNEILPQLETMRANLTDIRSNLLTKVTNCQELTNLLTKAQISERFDYINQEIQNI